MFSRRHLMGLAAQRAGPTAARTASAQGSAPSTFPLAERIVKLVGRSRLAVASMRLAASSARVSPRCGGGGGLAGVWRTTPGAGASSPRNMSRAVRPDGYTLLH